MKPLWTQTLPFNGFHPPLPTGDGLLLSLQDAEASLYRLRAGAETPVLQSVPGPTSQVNLLPGPDGPLVLDSRGVFRYEASRGELTPIPVPDFQGLCRFGYAATPGADRVAVVLDQPGTPPTLLCFNRAGHTLWRRELPPGYWQLHALGDQGLVAFQGLDLLRFDWSDGTQTAATRLGVGRRITAVGAHDDLLFVYAGGAPHLLYDSRDLSLVATLDLGYADALPVADDTTIYVLQHTVLTALDRRTRAVLWQTEHAVAGHPDNRVYAAPLLWRGRLYVVAHNGHVTCIDAADGSLIARQELGGFINFTPVAHNGCLYVLTNQPALHCLALDETAAAGSETAGAASGRHATVPNTPRTVSLGGFHFIQGVHPDGTLLVRRHDGTWLWLKDGEETRRLHMEGIDNPVPVGEAVYFTQGTDADCRLMCLPPGTETAHEVPVPDPGRDPLVCLPDGHWLYLEGFRQDPAAERRGGWVPVRIQTGPTTPWGLPIHRDLNWKGRAREEIVLLPIGDTHLSSPPNGDTHLLQDPNGDTDPNGANGDTHLLHAEKDPNGDTHLSSPPNGDTHLSSPPNGDTHLLHAEENSDLSPSLPAAAPDGAVVAFTLGGYGQETCLCFADPADGTVTRLPLPGPWDAGAPVWLDAETVLAAGSDGSTQTFTLVRRDGKTTRCHTHTGHTGEQWAVIGGHTLAFTSDYHALTLMPLI